MCRDKEYRITLSWYSLNNIPLLVSDRSEQNNYISELTDMYGTQHQVQNTFFSNGHENTETCQAKKLVLIFIQKTFSIIRLSCSKSMFKHLKPTNKICPRKYYIFTN